MHSGEMREQIKLCHIKSPQEHFQIFNPSVNDVEPFAEVWAKREDKQTLSRWGMVNTNVIDRKQFIIRHFEGLSKNIAVLWNNEVYSVFGISDLDNKKQWTMLLVGRVGLSESRDTIQGW